MNHPKSVKKKENREMYREMYRWLASVVGPPKTATKRKPKPAKKKRVPKRGRQRGTT